MFNVGAPHASTILCKKPFGVDLEKQKKKLKEFKVFLKELRKIGRNSELPFQRGMLVNISAIQGLFAYLQSKDSSIKYILTRRINQDDVERLFGIIRMMGHGANCPTRTDFLNRLKGLMLTRADEMQRIPISSNVAPCEDGWIRLKPNLPPDSIIDDDDIDTEDLALNNEIEGRCFNDEIECDVIGHIAGFIVHKLGHDIDDNITVTLWNNILSEGGLKDPSSTLIDYLQLLNDLFKSIFQVNVPHLIRKLMKASECDIIKSFENEVPALRSDKKLCDKIKDLFFRCIIRGRVRRLNEELRERNTPEEKQRAKESKTKEVKKHKRYVWLFHYRIFCILISESNEKLF